MQKIETKEIRYSKAFKETYIIVNDLAEELYSKIPKSFIKLIKENMNTEYEITLEKINENGVLPETNAILSLIFRDFLCEDEMKNKLIERDNQEIEQENEKYNNIFKKKDKPTILKELTVLPKLPWYRVLFDKFIKLIKRK